MEPVSAICPKCKKEVKVDSSEEVVFCEFCNQAFGVKEAIKLHTENVERQKAAKKPSDEAIAKFDAILKQDYKLAYTYVDDIIKKEYPPECEKYLSFARVAAESSYFLGNLLYNSIYDQQKYNGRTRTGLDQIKSVNSHVAEMYYQVLCRHVNALCQDIPFIKERNQKYSGGLALLKVELFDLTEQLDRIVSYFSRSLSDGDKYDHIEKYISGYKGFSKNDYDDEFICSRINVVTRLSASNVQVLRRKGKNVDDLIFKLEKLYSSAKQKEVAKQKKEEQKRREEAALLEWKRKEAERLKKEIAFWQKYIDLLKKRKAKEARAWLESNKRTNTDEFTKFKKGFLGVKYLGDVSSLNAETLAGAHSVKSV